MLAVMADRAALSGEHKANMLSSVLLLVAYSTTETQKFGTAPPDFQTTDHI
jgi:hypothetical protein